MISSLAGNARNKSASFSCLDMGTRPLFVFFPFSNFELQNLQKLLKQILEDINKKGPPNKSAKVRWNTWNETAESMT